MRGQRHLPQLRVLHFLKEAALPQVLVLQQRFCIEHCGEGYAQLLCARQQVLPVVFSQVRTQDLLELLPLHEPQPQVLKQRVALLLRLLDQDRHHQREARCPANHHDASVAAREDLAGIRRDRMP